jgi:NADPH:quinone reductase-like Zn-dependent oxidoreductase
MTRFKRVLLVLSALATVAAVSGALVLSHDSPCPNPAPLASGTVGMRAVMYRCYGPPEVLQLETVAKPVPGDDEILVKVRAAGLNPLDWHYMRGEPYIMRLSSGLGAPEDSRTGVDFAGVVESVGSKVTRFKPGDEVFGGRSGAFADYVLVRESRAIVAKPANLSFEQAAAVPVAAITALQGLRDKGHIQAGSKVLINGASGGVGTFAVQIAKTFGAEVTGVCSTRNLELVSSLGADQVIDYTKEDFTQLGPAFDLILDNVGNRSLSELRQVLKPSGTLVIIGGPSGDPWIGPMAAPLKASVVGPFVDQEMVFLMAELNQADLQILSDLMQSGKLTPVIDRSFALKDISAAMTYLEAGRARGKVIVNLE